MEFTFFNFYKLAYSLSAILNFTNTACAYSTDAIYGTRIGLFPNTLNTCHVWVFNALTMGTAFALLAGKIKRSE